MKPYTPHPIDNSAVSLTKRQMLVHIRKALADAKEASRYWPEAKWELLFDDLARQEAELAADIKRTDEATYGKLLRPQFVNTNNNLSARIIVHKPDDHLDMPYIPEASWTSLKRIVNSADGADIEVCADYEVYVCRRQYPIHTIPRYE